MKALKIEIFQKRANYRKPFAMKINETYPLPPYSTVNGLLHSILKATEYIPMNISIQGKYESIFKNFQTMYFYKSKEITSMPFNSIEIFGVSLIIHVLAPDNILHKIKDNILNSEDFLSLGRHEDILRIDSIKLVNIDKYNVDTAFTYEDDYENKNLSRYKIKNNIYINKNLAKDYDLNGISYRIATHYKNNAQLDNRRKMIKTDTMYIEEGQQITNGSILLDEDLDLVSFFDTNILSYCSEPHSI